MAKVVITVDTEEEVFDVSINGQKVEDVTQAMVYKYKEHGGKKDEYEISVNISTSKEDENGVKTYTSICASDSREGREAMKIGTSASSYSGFLINPVAPKIDIPSVHLEAKDKVAKAFAGFFGKKR